MKQNTHKYNHFDNSDISPWPFTWVCILEMDFHWTDSPRTKYPLQAVQDKCKQVFQEGLGTLLGLKASICVYSDAQP